MGGEYETVKTPVSGTLIALASAAAMNLAKSDAIADEVLENAAVFCNAVIQQIALIRELDPDDMPELVKDFDEIPEELQEQVAALAPLFTEWRNRH